MHTTNDFYLEIKLKGVMERKSNFSENQINIARRLTFGASVYQNYHLRDPLFRAQFEDGYKALLCFTTKYAYERQGAARAYPVIARMCLERLHKKNGAVTLDLSMKAWLIYKEIAEKEFNRLSVNASHNPMNSDKGIITAMATHKITNLALHIRELIKKGDTTKAHDFIRSIKGVGVKIAPFYLRDIAHLGNLREDAIKDPHYLQPIDTWLDQALAIIFQDKVPRKLVDKQKAIVELCKAAGCSAIAFNQGAWVLGSQMARSFKSFRQIAEGDNAKAIIEEHLSNMKQYMDEVQKLVQHFS